MQRKSAAPLLAFSLSRRLRCVPTPAENKMEFRVVPAPYPRIYTKPEEREFHITSDAHLGEVLPGKEHVIEVRKAEEPRDLTPQRKRLAHDFFCPIAP